MVPFRPECKECVFFRAIGVGLCVNLRADLPDPAQLSLTCPYFWSVLRSVQKKDEG